MAKWSIGEWRGAETAKLLRKIHREFTEARKAFVKNSPRFASPEYVAINQRLVRTELLRLRIKGYSVLDSELPPET